MEVNMEQSYIRINRRTFLAGTGMLATFLAFAPEQLFGLQNQLIQRKIPASGEKIPAIGMGTWQTFDIGDDPAAMAQLADVIAVFFEQGGRLIDSSPMYGRSEAVVGELLRLTGNRQNVFAATKVWTNGRQNGIEQMNNSLERMDVDVIDLMQIHNLRDWQVHLPVLQEWKKMGRLRYLGITTSHGRFHDGLAEIMRTIDLDFVQFTYNLDDRIAEQRLLPIAKERGIATLINRPFQGGYLFRRMKGTSLPEYSKEIGCTSWAQFFLKWIVSHPAVTCAIPATSKVHHMRDNMQAGFGTLPDGTLRQRMLKDFLAA